MALEQELSRLGVKPVAVELGMVEISNPLTPFQLRQFKEGLLRVGLEVLEDPALILIEKIKNLIIERVHYNDERPALNFSVYLSSRLQHNYTYLSRCFSQAQGISIEQFTILQKVERIKALMLDGAYTLNEISWMMHYSSPAHLSRQFKKMTGISPSCFRHRLPEGRVALEDISGVFQGSKPVFG